MRARDRFDVRLVYVWILTVVTWLFTLMAAFAVRGIEAASGRCHKFRGNLKVPVSWTRLV